MWPITLAVSTPPLHLTNFALYTKLSVPLSFFDKYSSPHDLPLLLPFLCKENTCSFILKSITCLCLNSLIHYTHKYNTPACAHTCTHTRYTHIPCTHRCTKTHTYVYSHADTYEHELIIILGLWKFYYWFMQYHLYSTQLDKVSLRLYGFQSLSVCLCCAVLSCSVVSNSLSHHGLQPASLLCPWGFSRQEYWRGLPPPPPRGSFQPRNRTQVSHIADSQST